jgi:hypothetical protein
MSFHFPTAAMREFHLKKHARDALNLMHLSHAATARNDEIGARVLMGMALNYLRIGKQVL